MINLSFAQTAASSATTATTAAMGAGGTTDTVQGHKNETNMLNSITMAVVGLIAARLYKYMPPTTDTILAAAGGAAFIFSEIQTTEDINDLNVTISQQASDANNQQVDALNKMKEKLQGLKDGVEKKKQIEMYAAIAFGAATAVALYETYTLYTSFKACEAAIKSGEVGIIDAIGAAACLAAEKPIMDLDLKSFLTTPSPTITEDTVVKALTALAASLTPGCKVSVGACNPLLIAIKSYTTVGLPITIAKVDPLLQQMFTPNTPTIITETNHVPTYIENIYDFFIPGANAGMMELIFGAGGVAAGLLLSTSLGPMVDNFMYFPLKRSIVWGVLAGLCYLAMNSSQDTIDQLQKSIDKINSILAAIQNNNGGGTPGNGTPITTPNTLASNNSTNGGASHFGTSGGTSMPCITPDCSSVNNAMMASPTWAAVDPKLQPVVLGVGTVASKMQGSSTLAGDAISGAGLNGAVSVVNKAIKNAQSALNAQLKKMGQSPMDFKAAQDNLLKDFNKATSDSLQKANMTPSQMLASMGQSGIGNSTGAGDATKEETKKTFAKNKLSNANQGFAGSIDKMPSLIMNDKAAVSNNSDGSLLMRAHEEYDLKNAEISSDKNANIFGLISERYIKSAFPKLLEKDIPESKK